MNRLLISRFVGWEVEILNVKAWPSRNQLDSTNQESVCVDQWGGSPVITYLCQIPWYTKASLPVHHILPAFIRVGAAGCRPPSPAVHCQLTTSADWSGERRPHARGFTKSSMLLLDLFRWARICNRRSKSLYRVLEKTFYWRKLNLKRPILNSKELWKILKERNFKLENLKCNLEK